MADRYLIVCPAFGRFQSTVQIVFNFYSQKQVQITAHGTRGTLPHNQPKAKVTHVDGPGERKESTAFF